MNEAASPSRHVAAHRFTIERSILRTGVSCERWPTDIGTPILTDVEGPAGARGGPPPRYPRHSARPSARGHSCGSARIQILIAVVHTGKSGPSTR